MFVGIVGGNESSHADDRPIGTKVSHRATTATGMASPGGGDAQQDPCRLFLGNLPKVKTDEDIRDEVGRMTRGLVRVITYKDPEDPRLHRGFCFLDYESAEAAAAALHRLSWNPVFGCRTIADWADPEPEMDADVMTRVRILFVRQYGGVLDEDALAAMFGRHGTVDRVKSLKNYAFVHFARRDDARVAMEALDGVVDAHTGIRMEVSWAKPPADKSARERTLRDRERRMLRSNGAWPSRSSPDPAVVASNVVGLRAHAAGHTYTGDNYDHYVYNFGVNACLTQAVCDGRPRQRRRHIEPVDRGLRYDGARVDVDGHSSGGDVDNKIRMFFLKMTVGEILGYVAPDKQ